MCEYSNHLGASVFRIVCCAEVISLVLVVCSVSAAAQKSVAVQGGSAEPVYSVVSPSAKVPSQ